MGRPLARGMRFQRGTWWASIPDKASSSGLRYESFLAEEDARAWLTRAVAMAVVDRAGPGAQP